MEPMYQYDINSNGVDPPLNYFSVRHQHSQTVRYSCSKCDSLFTSRQYLHSHEVDSHNRIFHCPFCPSLFSNKADFQTHIAAHTERCLSCAFCNKVFYQEDKYKAHMKEHKQAKFPCDQCSAWFDQYSMLRKHSNEFHVRKKFVHNLPKISRKYSSKRLLKKVRKELDFISKITGVPEQYPSQVTDSAVQVYSVPANPSVHNTASDCQLDDDFQVIESDYEESTLESGHCLKEKPKDIESVEEFSESLTNNEPNERDSSSLAEMNSGRNLRSRNTRKNYYSDDKIVSPLEKNKNSSSEAKIDFRRNLRPRNTVAKSKQGLSATRTKVCYNLRRRIEKKYDETIQPADNDNENNKPISSRSDISAGFFMCLSCKRIFSNYRLLNQHKRLHIHNGGHRCDKCGGLFGGAGNLALHQSSLCATT